MSKPVVSYHEVGGGSGRSYTVGFGLSLAFTLAAYLIVSRHVASGPVLLALLAILAVSQLAVQLVFFLHLNRESKPRWNLTAAAFALMVVVIIVFGSLWIMANLSHNHHHSEPVNQGNQTIIRDEGYSQ